MLEAISGGYGGTKLTHVSFEAHPESVNRVIEIRKYPAGMRDAAVQYAKSCVADTLGHGETLRIV